MRLNEVDRNIEIKRAGEIVSKMFGIENKAMQWESDAKPTIRGLVEQLDNPFLVHLTSDLDTFLDYGQKYVELDRSDIFESRTALPTYDDMLADPEYFAAQKNTVFTVVKMYPRLYAVHAKQGFKGMDGDFKPEEHLIFEYAKKVLNGSRMPMPYLQYELVQSKLRGEYTSFRQEGRHRATVAEVLGAHKMPVLIVASIEPQLGGPAELKQFSDEIWSKF